MHSLHTPLACMTRVRSFGKNDIKLYVASPSYRRLQAYSESLSGYVGRYRVTIMFPSRVACGWANGGSRVRVCTVDDSSARIARRVSDSEQQDGTLICLIQRESGVDEAWMTWKAEEGVETRVSSGNRSKPGCRTPPGRPYHPKLVGAVVPC